MKNGILIEASLLNEVSEIISQWERLIKKAAAQVGEVVPQVTAFNRYGRRHIERWISAGKLKPFRWGRRVYYFLWDLENAANVAGIRAELNELTDRLKAIQPAC